MTASNRKIRLQVIVSNDRIEMFDFEFCKARKVYVAYISKTFIRPLTYLCSFIVDDIPVLDSRYSTVYSGKCFYNKIDFSTLNKAEDEDDDEEEEGNKGKLCFKDESKFFNLKNIDFFRKKIEMDVKDEINTKNSKGFFARNGKNKGSNLSLSSLRKAEIKQAKRLQYVKSLSELLMKPPLKSILKVGAEGYTKKGSLEDERLSLQRKETQDSFGGEPEIYGFEGESRKPTSSVGFSSGIGFTIGQGKKNCIGEEGRKEKKPKKRVTIMADSVEVFDFK
eukprot:CAMPEP_0170518580 /NCGR_PEP_ID=MMETSP0209-20121228/4241_1 /TAXON_ID=665100 ORGANISM="Litonotus pictus, Strain P1" /NCGR_SAMPLE_ID=MMETSP0209 /ASSEMBLY_ACC=CAM_ASM_000301 /LENGTH=278 /DNA_ID=CAMNT_0010804197 /DNA_START=413 /DNA_END=1249 /DNA_ORIENTATION=-